MRIFVRFLTALSIVITASPALAADWWITTGDKDHIRFADASTIVSEGATRIAWLRWENEAPEKGVKYLMVRMKYDCSRFSMQGLEVMMFGPGDKLLTRRPLSEPVTYASPESINMIELEFACRYTPVLGKKDQLNDAFRLPANTDPTDFTHRMTTKLRATAAE